jgi:exonuclease I
METASESGVRVELPTGVKKSKNNDLIALDDEGDIDPALETHDAQARPNLITRRAALREGVQTGEKAVNAIDVCRATANETRSAM